jgi:hypothetical protein
MSLQSLISKLRQKSIVIFLLAFLTIFTVIHWFTPSSLNAAHPNDSPLTGEWRAKLQFKDGILASYKDLEFMYSFNAGGTLTESSNHDANPPVPPAYGIWRQTGAREFQAKYEFFITEAPPDFATIQTGGGWKPTARGVFQETITLSPDRKTYIAQVKLNVFNPAGQPIEGGGQATAYGQKLLF